MNTTDQRAQGGAMCMAGGVEWLIDAFDCDARRLASLSELRALAEALIAALELQVLGVPQLHQFGGPGGVTGLYLLSESHLAWHTYPESRLATFNLYCCRERPALDWARLLQSALGARRVGVTRMLRGAPADEASGPADEARTGAAQPAREGDSR